MTVTANATPKDDVMAVETAWSQALAANDTKGIGDHTAEDWVIVGAEGTVTPRARFVAAVASGDLVHDRMDLAPDMVRVYGDTAIISGEVRSGGTYKGQRFATHERSTDMFVRQAGRWRCVFTQMTALPAR